MSTIVKFKRSDVSGKIPQTGDLDFGELALNYADGAIYYKKPDGTIASISSGATAGTRRIREILVTAESTTFTFTGGGYTPGFLDVTLNGSQLTSSDYTATDGTTVVLTQAAKVDDILRLTAYDPVGLADTYRKAEVDELVNSTAITMAIALG